ncbi:MAG: KUP/HAK/KT family potassium transporter [Succiniclasticum sp.]|uniref:KUP/HAK/KT family potassium transporter n=1 Tax=Succiniclasticum sp. TaxID=2775030 RepID=UPI002A9108A8|nr:KUP/HAK/KT family potassium transporter [Succiniclasticum sp.]MDY6290089.1 KUP/HAK/KT family potassium transporter [Succiniclasticum sp.]
MNQSDYKEKFGMGMFLVALGIVYGDIGTSPMYVMKSIVEGNGGIAQVDREFIVGSLSLIIWTITLLTTIKHVLIALRADNHGEGGIFALYSLIRHCGKWLILPTMIGGCTMLADGVLTPAVTVTTAVEGLRSIEAMDAFLGSGQAVVIVIALAIISLLFIIQRSGTSSIGKLFGPVMMVWFLFLGITGLWLSLGDLSILQALNPVYAIKILFSPDNKEGFLILGSVFLCTTGAEALYTDMGHVGRNNIFISWPFVKICLILNYMGQCTWIIQNQGNPVIQAIEDLNPFYMMLPEPLRPVAILLSALAAIIASQALISGSYTLVHEAASLDLMPHLNVQYPSDTKGQIYIPFVNNILWFFCALVVLYFQSGSRMENAYGLAITISMLMMTVMFCVYIGVVHKQRIAAVIFTVVFFALEGVFFVSSLGKFMAGGYVAIIISLAILFIMICWYRGTQIEQAQNIFLKMREHLQDIKDLQMDITIPLCSHNMVYLVKGNESEKIDRDILYSILDKDPKRAEAYWFVSVNTTDDPYQKNYEVETYGTDYIFRVNLYLGYKVKPSVNIYLRQVVHDLLATGELPKQDKRHSIYGPSDVGSFKFCMIRKMMPKEGDIGAADDLLLRAKYTIRLLGGSPLQWFGLETSNLIIEYVPLFLPQRQIQDRLERI